MANFNNYYSLTKGSTRLHLTEIKGISGSHYFLHLFSNSTSIYVPGTALSLFYECMLIFVFCSVLQRVDLGRIYSSIAQYLEFDWSTQITCKCEAAGWCTATTKLTSISAVIFSDLFGAGDLFSWGLEVFRRDYFLEPF